MALRRLVTLVLARAITVVVGAIATGRIPYAVTTGVSMQPTYHPGDLVVVPSSPLNAS